MKEKVSKNASSRGILRKHFKIMENWGVLRKPSKGACSVFKLSYKYILSIVVSFLKHVKLHMPLLCCVGRKKLSLSSHCQILKELWFNKNNIATRKS